MIERVEGWQETGGMKVIATGRNLFHCDKIQEGELKNLSWFSSSESAYHE